MKEWCHNIPESTKLNKLFKCNIVDEDIYTVANSRLGWHKRSKGDVVNYLISPKVLAKENKEPTRIGRHFAVLPIIH